MIRIQLLKGDLTQGGFHCQRREYFPVMYSPFPDTGLRFFDAWLDGRPIGLDFIEGNILTINAKDHYLTLITHEP
jgi:hypothetical protein